MWSIDLSFLRQSILINLQDFRQFNMKTHVIVATTIGFFLGLLLGHRISLAFFETYRDRNPPLEYISFEYSVGLSSYISGKGPLRSCNRPLHFVNPHEVEIEPNPYIFWRSGPNLIPKTIPQEPADGDRGQSASSPLKSPRPSAGAREEKTRNPRTEEAFKCAQCELQFNKPHLLKYVTLWL